MRALLSVWDKAGVVEFARGLTELGWELYSTGKTQLALAAAGLPVRSVSDLTSFPEILDGRVKTLHPGVHAGILARRDDPAHLAQLTQHGIAPIDLVAVNLYPFVETIAGAALPVAALAGDPDRPAGVPADARPLPAAVQAAVEDIDIGGPAMIRSSAKNFPHVLVLTDPDQYAPVLEALRVGGGRPGGVPRSLRARLAQAAYSHTARYDAYVSQYFAALNGESFPLSEALPLTRVRELSYGENPHQQAAFYRLADPRLAGPGLADMEQLSGDDPSYNNLLDLDAANAIVADFDTPAVAIVKHNNPCGVGTGATLEEAYRKAYAGDPLSAFGGVVAANREVDVAMARAMSGVLYWVLVAPAFDPAALKVLGRRKTRVFALPRPSREANLLPGFALQYRPVAGGFLAQTRDAVPLDQVTFTVVSQRQPTAAEIADLRFAWRVVKHVRSNASVFVRDGAVVAVGAGQMSRVDSVVAATHVAGRSVLPAAEADGQRVDGADAGPQRTAALPVAGCVMATDGYFPFPDAVEAAAVAGATAIAHPGGSKEDEASIAAADRLGLAMVVTGYRHFRH